MRDLHLSTYGTTYCTSQKHTTLRSIVKNLLVHPLSVAFQREEGKIDPADSHSHRQFFSLISPTSEPVVLPLTHTTKPRCHPI